MHVCGRDSNVYCDVILFPGQTALNAASYYGFLDIIKYLAEHNADIESKNNNGMLLNFDTAVLSGLYARLSCMFVDSDPLM